MGNVWQDWEVIIVGAGSAGAPLAARLSEDASRRILLLESGADTRSTDVPADMRTPNPHQIQYLEAHAGWRWPNLAARRADGQERLPYIRGRGMGGSSAVNGLVAIRGLPEDFDGWAENGCEGWEWENVLPAFIRLEDELDFPGAPWHGRGGPTPISRNPVERWGALDLAVREAALDLGYGWSDDHNAPASTGCSPFAMNTGRDGVRVSTADSYLEPNRGRENLTILGDAHVDRVIIERGRAVGVRVRIAGEWREARAKEVILCAGAVHSPAILQRSGIGPAERLNRLGIEVQRDLPVGENLVDHPIVWVNPILRPEFRATRLDLRHEDACVRYSSGLAGAGRNDMIVLCTNFTGTDEAGLAVAFIGVSAFQTFSNGWLGITTPDPDIDPEIELRMLSDERDLARMRDGTRRLFEVARHPAIARVSERVALGRSAGLTMDDVTDPASLDTWLHASVFDTYHPAGTCRMGAPDDPRSTVDPACRVIGIDGLRVADASIMPEIVRANLHLTCVMIGEHVAEIVMRDA